MLSKDTTTSAIFFIGDSATPARKTFREITRNIKTTAGSETGPAHKKAIRKRKITSGKATSRWNALISQMNPP